MKKSSIFKFILLTLLLVPITILAGNTADDITHFELKYTSDSCMTTKIEECNGNCQWIEERGCGINLDTTSYKCYYYLQSGVSYMVTAYFNSKGLSSLEYASNDPTDSNNKAFVNETPTPIIKNQNNELIIYTCPETLYYSQDDTQIRKEDNTDVYYKAFATSKKSNSDILFSLLKDESYAGFMMVKKVGEENGDELTPKVCSYTKKVGLDQRTITITYHDKSNVSINYTGLALNGSSTKGDPTYILNSQYFKDWVCPPENLVYAYVDENGVLHVAYNKDDLGDHDNIFEYVDNSSSNDDDNYNPGDEVYGCEVVPEEIRKWIGISLNFIKYIALILVIVLGTIDFIKAAGSGEPDAMKKAGQTFMKRVVAVIILFLLPMIIDLILRLINLYGSTDDCFNVLS